MNIISIKFEILYIQAKIVCFLRHSSHFRFHDQTFVFYSIHRHSVSFLNLTWQDKKDLDLRLSFKYKFQILYFNIGENGWWNRVRFGCTITVSNLEPVLQRSLRKKSFLTNYPNHVELLRQKKSLHFKKI